jgi:hypothetical protein
MATTVSTRSLSFLQPFSYGTDFRQASNQQPFSLTLSSDPRAHHRSPSRDTHRAATMGFLKDKVSVRARQSPHPRTPPPEVTNRILVENADDSPKRPNRFLLPSLQRVKPKRSFSGLFSSNGDAPSIAMALDMISTPFIDGIVNSRPTSTPPAHHQRVSVIPEAQYPAKEDKFQPQNHFLTKYGMKHHPYPHEVPYMQAYDPVLLDK